MRSPAQEKRVVGPLEKLTIEGDVELLVVESDQAAYRRRLEGWKVAAVSPVCRYQ